jgi:[calcium/calmodulin-dependent protein kinase] kinase
MELCARDLNALILKPPNFRLKEHNTRIWFRQIVKGLQGLHEQNISYMDIKPSNILYKLESSGKYIFKLTDFGLSFMLRTEETATTNQTKGTPHYMVPEIFTAIDSGISYETKPTDIYSLGLTLAYSLCALSSIAKQ